MASGSVDFPEYMKEVHEDWMRQSADAVTSSVTDLINLAIASTPYTSKAAFDPDTRLTAMASAVTALNTRVDALNPTTNFTSAITTVDSAYDGIYDDNYFAELASGFYDVLEDQLDNVTIPAFQGGMRNINAVMSSAFVLGEALIRSFASRDTNKFLADIKYKNHIAKIEKVFAGADRIVQSILAQVDLEKAVAHYTIEVNRMGIAAQKEETDQNLAIAIGNRKFPFDAFQYGANVLASVSGGTAYPNTDASAPSQTQSALAGALAGASLGNSLSGGSGWGTGIGALAGLGLALFGD